MSLVLPIKYIDESSSILKPVAYFNFLISPTPPITGVGKMDFPLVSLYKEHFLKQQDN